MKKISLAVAAALLSSAAVQASGDNFTGFYLSGAGSYGVAKTTDTNGKAYPAFTAGTVQVAAPADKDNTVAVIDPSLFSTNGSLAGRLNVGYRKVMANNMLVGASAFGGWNFEKNTGIKSDGKIDMRTALTDPEVLAGSWNAGVSLNLGMVVMPKLAIRLIGDVSYDNYKFTNDSVTSGTTKDATLGVVAFAGGAAVDFAATDRLLISVGGKYNFMPSDLKFVATDNKDLLKADRSFARTGSWNLFAEIGFRITQN